MAEQQEHYVTPKKAAAKPGDLIYNRHIVINPELIQKEKAYLKSKSTQKEVFVKYLTSDWAKASSYKWGKSVTVKWEVTGNVEIGVSKAILSKLGLTASRTKTYSVVTTIPASKTKYSKLGFASDYTKTVYTYKKYMNDKILFARTETMKTPNKTTYLKVYYK